MKYLIAHRGLNNHEYGENTIDGCLDSLNYPYIQGIEIDIRMTKDHKLVLHHNYLYKLHIINHTKYKEIKELPLLENLLKKISSKKIILLDIKCETEHYQVLVKYLLRVINKYKLNYYLCSFNYDLAKYLTKKTKYPVGIFITDLINKHKDYRFLSFLALSKNSYNDILFSKKFVWTINNKKNITKYDYIITDKAYLLSK